MDVVHEWVLNHIEVCLLILSVFVLIFMFLFLVMSVRMRNVSKQYKRMMRGRQTQDLEQLLFQYLEEVNRVIEKQDQIQASIDKLERSLQQKIGPVGVIRFNAFGDTGSDLSFAIALLDSQQNGVVLSSIFGREESRTYAKPIINGSSSYFLTDEEKEAIQLANRNS
jgi:hypothetical protein